MRMTKRTVKTTKSYEVSLVTVSRYAPYQDEVLCFARVRVAGNTIDAAARELSDHGVVDTCSARRQAIA
jgi:hypothetical protein